MDHDTQKSKFWYLIPLKKKIWSLMIILGVLAKQPYHKMAH